jgi:hypothetical protein
MTASFHSGYAYQAFDRIIRAVEAWLAGRVPAVGGCEAAAVRERLTQRVVEIGLWPFVGICARRLQAGDVPVPPPEQALDCGGITFYPASGCAAISLCLFARSLLEFGIHWLHVLGAILAGGLPFGARDSRPATLVFGIGHESLFTEGSDARFATYCRAGPIKPMIRARRFIIQCAALGGRVTDPNFVYDRFPLHALIRDAKLGMTGRAALFCAHLAAPLMLLVAVMRRPLLALLARDIAYMAAVKALDRLAMIEAVVITNSTYTSQPLWMRGPVRRHYSVHMVWYSQNTIPFVYARDGLVSDSPNYRHMRFDETWVWTPGYKAYLEKLGLPGLIHVVGPILWYLPESPPPRTSDEIRIAVFDVTPVRDDVALRIGLVDNYYCTQNMVQFIEETILVCRQLERQTGRRVHALLKHKRSYSAPHDPRYIELIERLSAPGASLELVPFQTNMYSLLADCDLSIVVPYSSPAYVASALGIRAVYFDPTAELAPSFEKASLVDFASGRDELLRIASDAISAATATGDHSVT